MAQRSGRRRGGRLPMGLLATPHSVVLLAVVAIIAAACGFAASTAMRRTKRHTRRVFVLGVLCGFMASAVSSKWLGGRNAVLRAGAYSLAVPNLWRQSQRRRQPLWFLRRAGR